MSNPTFHIAFHRLDLKYTWAISRNATDFKLNGFVTVSDGTYTGIGEAAPNVRYGETPESFQTWFDSLTLLGIQNLEELAQTLKAQNVPNALRFGIESAWVHYVCAKENTTVARFFGLSEPTLHQTSFTVPIMPIGDLAQYFATYQLGRFQFIKLKVNRDNLVDFVRESRKHTLAPIIVDANEAYTNPDILLGDLKKLSDQNIEFIEQPFPAACFEEYRYLKNKSPFPVFADESITDEADFDYLAESFHGINVKLMKAGGYLNAIHLLKEARKRGLKTMIGCMVETGLGISSGLHLASLAHYLDLDSFLFLKNDLYPLVSEMDGKLFLDNKQRPV
ncbi:MAG TPA: dipeptide epimerase [Cytophagales bacterium]|nr:dipeptide epimerase [Cytophagales bacterium]